jgi:glutathione-independent formaldehyde dehydrogenase
MHMVRGRMELDCTLLLGHEILGEVIEIGRDVEFIEKGDIVSPPAIFNVS